MARQRRSEPERTAAETYRACATEIEVQMEAIGEALDRHHAAHLANTGNWAMVGDLGRVRDLLGEVIGFLPKAGAR